MIDLAQIIQDFGIEYLLKFSDKILPSHLKAMQAITECKTPPLGGQVYTCGKCNTKEYSYHSCNNRNCPKCGGNKIQQWVNKQFKLLLPVPYFFVIFTLPQELRFIVRANQKLLYSLFFKASADALKLLAKEKRFLAGDIGFFGVIQTWARNLIFHPHIHYIVPGIALSFNRRKYIKIKNKKFLMHIKPLKILFKRLFMQALQNTPLYDQVPDVVWQKDWVINIKAAGSGQEVIKYLAAYVYRVALSNNKIKKLNERTIAFEYTDYQTKKNQECRLDVLEFMRRFLQHVLPLGFMKIRYFGIMGANTRNKWLLLKHLLFKALCKRSKELFLDIRHAIKKQKHCCRKCGGELVLIGVLPRAP
jgi:hypothetical protein